MGSPGASLVGGVTSCVIDAHVAIPLHSQVERKWEGSQLENIFLLASFLFALHCGAQRGGRTRTSVVRMCTYLQF